jgi:hypothetical protein
MREFDLLGENEMFGFGGDGLLRFACNGVVDGVVAPIISQRWGGGVNHLMILTFCGGLAVLR